MVTNLQQSRTVELTRCLRLSFPHTETVETIKIKTIALIIELKPCCKINSNISWIIRTLWIITTPLSLEELNSMRNTTLTKNCKDCPHINSWERLISQTWCTSSSATLIEEPLLRKLGRTYSYSIKNKSLQAFQSRCIQSHSPLQAAVIKVLQRKMITRSLRRLIEERWGLPFKNLKERQEASKDSGET